MATTEELLAELAEVTEDQYIVVDPETRQLTVPASEAIFGVYSDKDVERKWFKCPKVVGDDVDLSQCYIFINYFSSGGTYGQYQCETPIVEGDNIIFSWLLSENVFDSNTDSTIHFAVQAKNADTDGNAANIFVTTPAVGTTFATVGPDTPTVVKYADIILQLLAKMDTCETKVAACEEKCNAYNGIVPLESTGANANGSIYPRANKMTKYSPLTKNCTVFIHDVGPSGYDNEVAFTITQGATAYSVTMPTGIKWVLGIAPSFAANTTTLCRIYWVNGTTCGEWVVV